MRKNDTRRAHRIDTQFIIAEHVLGPNLASTIARLASNDKLTVEFLRSAMFQVLFAMAAAERTSVRFRHFDPHVRNVQLSLKHEDDEEDEKVHGSWEFRIADSERSKRSNVVYRVPREATRAAKMVLIDYGTSVTDDPITGKQRGPWLYRVFRSRLRAMIINGIINVRAVLLISPRLTIMPHTVSSHARLFRGHVNSAMVVQKLARH